MKNTLIQIASGAGYGKSVLASKIYLQLIEQNYKVDLVQELVKKYAYIKNDLGIKISECNLIDFKVINEALKDNKFVIYDNCLFSNQVYTNGLDNCPAYKFLISKFNIVTLHIVNLNHNYNPVGRIHTQEESKEINSKFKNYLEYNKITYFSIPNTNNFNILDVLQKN